MSGEEARHIPIDIHLGQLVDWLVSRRHCTKDWHNNLQNIREKLAPIHSKLMQNDATRKILEASDIPTSFSDILYIHWKSVMDALSESEHGAKNLLGHYQSPLTRELAEALKMYEKDNIYLAELSQVVYRNITYDIPFIKKRIQKLDQTSADCLKKSDDSIKSAKDFREQYLKDCSALGIEGRNVRDELLQGAKILPHLYENIAQQSHILAPVCKFVEEFMVTVHKGAYPSQVTSCSAVLQITTENEVLPGGTKFWHSFSWHTNQLTLTLRISGSKITFYSGWIKDQTGEKLFPLLHHVMKHGNKPYPLDEEAQSENTFANEEVMETAPRTGPEDDTESSKASLDVNLNDTVADHLDELNNSSSEIIDFDINDSAADEGVEEVNWDFGTDGINIVVEDSGESSKNLLDTPELRTQLVNELYELLAFLQRRMEEQTTEHMASELLNVNVGDSRLVSDKKLVTQLIGNVREILELFSDHRLQSLCKLHDSASFLERLTKQLEQKLIFAIRMENRSESYKVHRAEALEERRNVEPELMQLIESTKQIQKFVEQEISRKYQDRRVAILGGIQSVS